MPGIEALVRGAKAFAARNVLAGHAVFLCPPEFQFPTLKAEVKAVVLMQGPTKPSTVLDILHQRCPRCRSGRIFRCSIFRGFPKMHERCPVCGLKFEREQGYFLGAMYISYGVALVMITALAALLWSTTPWPITKVTVWAIVLFMPLALPTTLMARVLWIYLDQAVDPDKSFR